MPSDCVGFLTALQGWGDLWGLALIETEFPLPRPLLRKGRGGSEDSPLGECSPLLSRTCHGVTGP